MYKMVEEIIIETWEKCGITTVKHYNEKENIIGLWHRMSDVKRQIGHSNIADVALKIKQKTLQEKKNKNTKKVIQLRKKLGYNHDDIMVHEETSIAEKIIKLFTKENTALNKKFNNRKPDIWFKDHNIIEVDERNHENHDSDDEKEREDLVKNHNFKIF